LHEVHTAAHSDPDAVPVVHDLLASGTWLPSSSNRDLDTVPVVHDQVCDEQYLQISNLIFHNLRINVMSSRFSILEAL